MTTTEQFEDALAGLMQDRGISGYELERLTRERHPAPKGEWSKLAGDAPDHYGRSSPGLSRQTISALLSGDLRVTPRAIEIISDALGAEVSPNYFPEYRLDVARERLNWRAPDRKSRGRRLALALRALEAH
jgi:transcriptional regulator with XRE-family HTH domain